MKSLNAILGGVWLTGWLAAPVLTGAAEVPAADATNTATLTLTMVSTATNTAAQDSADTPDNKRLTALAMIETGNNDWEVGGQGEISRYQLSPAVWKSYTTSDNYTDPDVSMQVAWQHWKYLANYFKQRTGHEPDDFDMYVLWNTRFGYYERKGFSRHEISPVVQERASRFVNLVNRKV